MTVLNQTGGSEASPADGVSGRRPRVSLLWAVALLATVGGCVAGLRHLNGPRWVGHAVSPEGVEMGVLQECNWSGEPFTTRFVFRQPGGAWAAFYYDHQDDYWRKSRVWLDTNAGLAWFYRGAKPAVTFAWRTETCFLHRRNRTDREPTPMPANWSPPGAW